MSIRLLILTHIGLLISSNRDLPFRWFMCPTPIKGGIKPPISPKKSMNQERISPELIIGTLVVMALYVLLQVIMLKHASVTQLAGQAEVTTISFANILDSRGVLIISVCIAIQLIATISSYVSVSYTHLTLPTIYSV